jgi:hypothetical protein
VKSCFGLLLVLVVFSTVVTTAGVLFYLSSTAEFTRADKPAAAPAAAAPAAPSR